MKQFTIYALIVVCLVLVGERVTQAAGFEVVEQSGRSIGSAYAGKSATGDDPAVVAFNPACMVKLRKFQTATVLSLISPSGEWHDKGSTGPYGGATGNDGGDPGVRALIPNFYAVGPVDENLSVGFGSFTTFGLKTDWKDGWQGRYHALHSSVEQMNFNLAGAYRCADWFSFGLGINYQRARAKLSNAVDFGSIAFAATQPPGVRGSVPMFLPEQHDGEVTIESDWSDAWGWNAGILIEFTEETRIGMSYRSSVDHSLKGRAKFKVPPEVGFLTGMGTFTNSKVKADVEFPDQFSFSAHHDLDEKWAVVSDITWTNWSKFKELRVDFANPAQPPSIQPENWDDTYRFALGAIHKYNDFLTVRMGTAYDQSPIPDKFRTPRIPGNDRWWITVGVGLKLSERVTLDIGFIQAFFKDGKVNDTVATGQTVKGKASTSAQVVAFQVTIDL